MYPNRLAREIVKCTFCKYSSHSTLKIGQLRSYRVKGITKPSPVWEWSTGTCENPLRCWGENIRKWTVLKSNTEDWVFRTTMSDPLQPNRSSLIDELREGLNKNVYRFSEISPRFTHFTKIINFEQKYNDPSNWSKCPEPWNKSIKIFYKLWPMHPGYLIEMQNMSKIFLYNTKHVSKHLEAINDILKYWQIFLITFHRRGTGQASVKNSTKFIIFLFNPSLRVKLKQGNGTDRLLYSGVASAGHCRSFWPMIDSEFKVPNRKVIVHMRQGFI